MIKILVCGIAGHMGRNICELLAGDSEAEVGCGVAMHESANLTGTVYKTYAEEQ